MNKFTLFLCFSYALNAADTSSDNYLTSKEWNWFKNEFGKSYHSTDEEKDRFNVFMEHKRIIEEHNKKFYSGEETYEMGINDFSDLRHEELVGMTGNYNPKSVQIAKFKEENKNRIYKASANFTVPPSVNWRAKRIVTRVKQQGNCMGCWAFSAIASIEALYNKKYRTLIDLSEQDLIDCTTSKKYGNNGCTSGNKEVSFDYVKDNGIATTGAYPYQGETQRCKRNPDYRPWSRIIKPSKVKIKGYVRIPSGDENALKSAVAEIGPIAVSFYSAPSFANYQRGIYCERKCNNSTTNHALLLVGYGTEKVGDYWLLKNSWGKNWGLDGYVKVARNQNNQCAIATYASYPQIV